MIFLHSKILSMGYKFDFSRSKLSVITNVFSSSRKKKKKKRTKKRRLQQMTVATRVLLQLPFNRLNNRAPYTRAGIIVFCITKDGSKVAIEKKWSEPVRCCYATLTNFEKFGLNWREVTSNYAISAIIVRCHRSRHLSLN